MAPSRRAFLASAASLLPPTVAGCAGVPDPRERDGSPERDTEAQGAQIPAARLQMMPVDDADIGKRHARHVGRYTVHAGRPVIERAVENGSTTIDAEFPPVNSGERVWWSDRGVYRFDYEIGDERPATRYFWNLEPAEEAAERETVRFEDLSRIDREKFRLVGLADGAYGERSPLDVGGTFKYANEDRDESALVPTPEHPVIVWGPDRRARFSVTDSNSKNATLKTYRYTADRIAPTVAAYGRELRDRYTFELSGLSDAERGIVEQAVEDHGYTVERGESPPEAFGSLAEKLRRQEAVNDHREGITGEYLATYDEQIYWAELINGADYGRRKTATTSAQ